MPVTRISTPGSHTRRHSDVPRTIAWAFLVVAVAAAHLSLPWAWGLSRGRVELTDHAPAETRALHTRRIAAETLPPRSQSSVAAEPSNRPALSPPLLDTRTAPAPERAENPAETRVEEAPAVEAATALESEQGTGPVLYTVSGQFSGRTVSGNATLQWKIDPDAYLISLQVTASHQFTTTFAWQLKTIGTVDRGVMKPALYDEARLLAGEGRQSHLVEFEREPTPDPANGPRMDPLSAMLRLSSDLHTRSSELPSSFDRISEAYPIVVRVGNRSLHFNFRRAGAEELSTPFGMAHTEKFVTEYPNPFHDHPQISLWLAPAFRHAPVRVQIEQPEVAVLSFDLSTEPVSFPAWR
jgi:hypothetical protein